MCSLCPSVALRKGCRIGIAFLDVTVSQLEDIHSQKLSDYR